MGKTLLGMVIGILIAGAAFLILGRSSEELSVSPEGPLEQQPTADIVEPNGAIPSESEQDVNRQESGPEARPLSEERNRSADNASSADGNVRIASALPTLSDFEIELQYIGRYANGLSVPEIMAAEPRDDQWAPGMEGFLYAEAVGSVSAPITKVDTECRTTWCGVVIEVPESIPYDVQNSMEIRFRESLGASDSRSYSFGRPNDPGGHIVYYLKMDR